jgi:hypothetical protein
LRIFSSATTATGSPSGPLVFQGDADAPAVIEQVAALPDGARIAYYPYIPLMPFLVGRPQAIAYDVFVPQYTTEGQYQNTCADIASNIDYVVWDRWESDLQILRTVYPTVTESEGKTTLETAIRDGFDVVFERGRYQIRKRNSRAPEALCATAGEPNSRSVIDATVKTQGSSNRASASAARPRAP